MAIRHAENLLLPKLSQNMQVIPTWIQVRCIALLRYMHKG